MAAAVVSSSFEAGVWQVCEDFLWGGKGKGGPGIGEGERKTIFC